MGHLPWRKDKPFWLTGFTIACFTLSAAIGLGVSIHWFAFHDELTYGQAFKHYFWPWYFVAFLVLALVPALHSLNDLIASKEENDESDETTG